MERLAFRSGRRGTHNGQYENGHGQRGRGRERGGLQGDRVREQEVRRRAQSQGPSQRDADRQRGGARGGGRGGHRGGGAERLRLGGGRNEQPGGAERQVMRAGAAGTGTRRGGHNGDRREGRDGTDPSPRKLGYKTLEDLSKQEPSVVAITLSSNPGFRVLLGETPMRPDLVQLICLVVSKAFTSRTDRSTLQHLANIIKESKFLSITLLHYVGGMMSDSNQTRRGQFPQHMEYITAILLEVLSIFPASSVNTVNMLVTLLQASINTLRASGVDFLPKVEEKMENLKGLIAHLQERSRKGTLRTDKDTYGLLTNADDNEGEEQEDFRNIPLYPTPEEFHQSHKPFLRPNLTSQRYTNTHLYLDTHFRLLREDFVRPLREGIQQLLQNQLAMGRNDNPLKMKRFDDIRVYFATHLVVPKCTQTGLAYIAQFDVQPLKFVRWQNSKRLLFGSLVCLSYDNFESFLFATVSDRDPKYLEKGQVQITFTEESRVKLARIQTDQLFLMVETTAYFEAYRYVLEGLKEQTEDDLPFQR